MTVLALVEIRGQGESETIGVNSYIYVRTYICLLIEDQQKPSEHMMYKDQRIIHSS